jgi:hypothetical protein
MESKQKMFLIHYPATPGNFFLWVLFIEELAAIRGECFVTDI